MARVRKETDDRNTLGVAGPSVDACLGEECVLGARLGGEVGCLGDGGVHVGPALVVGHGLAVEDGGLLADAAALGFCLFLDEWDVWLVVLLGLVVGLLLLDAVQKGGVVLALPRGPRADVCAVAVDDIEVAPGLALALEVPFVGVGGPDGVHGGIGVLGSGVEGAEDGGCGGVDGGVGGVAEDGVCEVLCVEGMVGHGLHLNVAGECVLIEEAVAVRKGVVWAVEGELHVVEGDIDMDLGVGRAGDELGLRGGVLQGGEYRGAGREGTGSRTWRRTCGAGSVARGVPGRVRFAAGMRARPKASSVSSSEDMVVCYVICRYMNTLAAADPHTDHDQTCRRPSLDRPRRSPPRHRRRRTRPGRQLEGRRARRSRAHEQGLQKGKPSSLPVTGPISPRTALAALPIALRQEVRLVQGGGRSPSRPLPDPRRPLGRHRTAHPRAHRRRVLEALSRGPRSVPQEARLDPRRGRASRRRVLSPGGQMGPRRPRAPTQRLGLP